MLQLTRLPEDLGTGEELDTPMECEPIDLYMFLLLLLKDKLFFEEATLARNGDDGPKMSQARHSHVLICQFFMLRI